MKKVIKVPVDVLNKELNRLRMEAKNIDSSGILKSLQLEYYRGQIEAFEKIQSLAE